MKNERLDNYSIIAFITKTGVHVRENDTVFFL